MPDARHQRVRDRQVAAPFLAEDMEVAGLLKRAGEVLGIGFQSAELRAEAPHDDGDARAPARPGFPLLSHAALSAPRRR